MNDGRLKITLQAILIATMLASLSFMITWSPSDDVYADSNINPYYDSLVKDGRTLYDAFVSNAEIKNLDQFVVTLDNDYDENVSKQAFHAFKWSNPQYFWIDFVSYYMNTGDMTSVYVTFVPIEPVKDATDMVEKIDELQVQIDRAVEDYPMAGLLRYDLIKGFHDRIIDNCSYDVEAASSINTYDNAFNILGVFIDRSAVCQGYSLAMKYLCDIAKVPCLNIVGSGYSNPDESESHMWNYIQMEDGEWYCMDVTWDDPTSSWGDGILTYDHFLVGSDTVIRGMKFIESHVPDYKDVSSHFAESIPSPEKSPPMRLSMKDYDIRPGSEDDVVYVIGDGGDEPFILTRNMIDPADPENILDKVGSKGKGVIISNNVRFILSAHALNEIFIQMKKDSSNMFIFGCHKENRELKGIFNDTFHKEVYTPFIFNEGNIVNDLGDIGDGIEVTVSIPYELKNGDLEFFLYAWAVDHDGNISFVESSNYDGGNMDIVISGSMDRSYMITSNPFGDFSMTWVIVIGIIALLIVLLVIILVIVLLSKLIKRFI